MIIKLEEYMKDPSDPVKNFNVGYEYEKMGQTASAVSFYIRAAEKTEDSLLKFESMIRAAKCFDKQGRRNFSTEGLLQFAIAVMPNRSEGYYLLSKLYRIMHKWRECSLYAQLGLQYESFDDLKTDIEYPGNFALIYEKAIGDWHIGLYEKAKLALYNLKYNVHMNSEYEKLVNEKLHEYGYPDSIPYDQSSKQRFKFTFDGIENIEKNYSKHMQDMFILTMLNGKKNGTYLEIGAGYSHLNSNTALLEEKFYWKGVSVDISSDLCNEFFAKRKNPILKQNSLEIDYFQLLDDYCFPYEIDYLQIDCDEASYETLRKIPFDDFKFAIIHFEHDVYRLDPLIREYSRDILKSKGYVLLVNDVAINETDSHEDWWVHPDLIEKSIMEQMKTASTVNFIGTYMFNTYKQNSNSKSMKPYILSLKDCYDRRQILEKTMIQNGMKKWEMCIFDKVENSNIRFNGASEDIPLGILSSHLCTIKKWYEESNDDYGLFFEDDVSFESKKHWNFDLVDFISRLPGDWSAIQLCGIYQVKPDIRLRVRDHIDHGLQAYVLTRSFAKKLISETFAFDKSINITKPYISSSVENIVLNPKYGKVYTFPLFNHNIFDFKSTSIEYDNKNFTDGQSHLAIASYNEISNWWAEKGCKLSLEEILEL